MEAAAIETCSTATKPTRAAQPAESSRARVPGPALDTPPEAGAPGAPVPGPCTPAAVGSGFEGGFVKKHHRDVVPDGIDAATLPALQAGLVVDELDRRLAGRGKRGSQATRGRRPSTRLLARCRAVRRPRAPLYQTRPAVLSPVRTCEKIRRMVHHCVRLVGVIGVFHVRRGSAARCAARRRSGPGASLSAVHGRPSPRGRGGPGRSHRRVARGRGARPRRRRAAGRARGALLPLQSRRGGDSCREQRHRAGVGQPDGSSHPGPDLCLGRLCPRRHAGGGRGGDHAPRAGSRHDSPRPSGGTDARTPVPPHGSGGQGGGSAGRGAAGRARSRSDGAPAVPCLRAVGEGRRRAGRPRGGGGLRPAVVPGAGASGPAVRAAGTVGRRRRGLSAGRCPQRPQRQRASQARERARRERRRGRRPGGARGAHPDAAARRGGALPAVGGGARAEQLRRGGIDSPTAHRHRARLAARTGRALSRVRAAP